MTIASFTDANKTYQTTANYCSCPDHQFRNRQCKHQRALILELARAQMFLFLKAKFDVRSQAVIEEKRANYYRYEMAIGA